MPRTLSAKPTVNWDVCKEIEAAQDTIAMVYREAKAQAVVTSARDSKHSAKTAHTDGRALDLRITNLFRDVSIYSTKEWFQKVTAFAGVLAEKLEWWTLENGITGRFDVVVEEDHLHLEYTPSGMRPNIKNWQPTQLVYTTGKVKGFMA